MMSSFPPSARRLRTARPRLRPLAVACLLAVAGEVALAQAVPQLQSVRAGTASVTTSGRTHVTVDQSSQRAVIDWVSFSIGSGGSVTINQPNAQSVLLNRVVGSPAFGFIPQSVIEGSLSANGRVFLLNPSGTVIGAGAQINVGGLLVSSLDVQDTSFNQFMNTGTVDLVTSGGAGRVEVHSGARITAAANGEIVLIGNAELRNSNSDDSFSTASMPLLGSVAVDGQLQVASTGRVQLAAGGGATVSLPVGSSGFVSLTRVLPATQAMGVTLGAGAQVDIPGGSLRLEARSADTYTPPPLDVDGPPSDYGSGVAVVTMDGAVQAAAVDGQASHTQFIAAGAVPFVTVGGGIDASAGAGAVGGTIVLDAAEVLLQPLASAANGAVLNVNGGAGGGTILIGGADTRGITAREDTQLLANATEAGNGGTITLQAFSNTADPSDSRRPAFSVLNIGGNVLAQGRGAGHRGGQVETSAAALNFSSLTVDASGQAGAVAGTWTIDPYDITISNAPSVAVDDFTPTAPGSNLRAEMISRALDNGTSVTVTTGTGGTQTNGNITVTAGTTIERNANAPAVTLRLEATGSVVLDANAGIVAGTGAGPLNIVLASDANADGEGGVWLRDGGNTLATRGGSVVLGGLSGAAVGGTSGQAGVDLANATIDTRGAAGAGAVAMTGRALTGTGSSGVKLNNTRVDAGDIQLNGTADTGLAVALTGGTMLSGTSIQLQGAASGASQGVGVWLDDARLAFTNTLSVTGSGAAGGVSLTQARLEGTGSGSTQITMAGTATGAASGVQATSSQLTAGVINLQGSTSNGDGAHLQGTVLNAGTRADLVAIGSRRGVSVQGGQLTAPTLNLQGQTLAGAADAAGLWLGGGAQLTGSVVALQGSSTSSTQGLGAQLANTRVDFANTLSLNGSGGGGGLGIAQAQLISTGGATARAELSGHASGPGTGVQLALTQVAAADVAVTGTANNGDGVVLQAAQVNASNSASVTGSGTRQGTRVEGGRLATPALALQGQTSATAADSAGLWVGVGAELVSATTVDLRGISTGATQGVGMRLDDTRVDIGATANVAGRGAAGGVSIGQAELRTNDGAGTRVVLAGEATGGGHGVQVDSGGQLAVRGRSTPTARTGADLHIGGTASQAAALALGSPVLLTDAHLAYRPMSVDAQGNIGALPDQGITVANGAVSGPSFVLAPQWISAAGSVAAAGGVVLGSQEHRAAITVAPGATVSTTGRLTLQNSAGTGGVAIDGAVQAGQLALLTGGNVSQTAAVQVDRLAIVAPATSTVVLENANNRVGELAFDPPHTLRLSTLGPLTVGTAAAVSLDAAGSFSTSTIGAGGSSAMQRVVLRSLDGDLILQQPIEMLGAGSQLDLVAAQLFRNPSNSVLSNGTGGSWRIWSTTWVNGDKGGLAGDRPGPNVYGCSFGDTTTCSGSGAPLPTSGNRFLYQARPTLNVAADSYTVAQGHPLPTFQFTVSGLQNDDLLSEVLSGSPSAGVTSHHPAGRYTIGPGSLQALQGYQLDYVAGSLTLSPPGPSQGQDAGSLMALSSEGAERRSEVYGSNLELPQVCSASTLSAAAVPDAWDTGASPLALEWSRVRSQPQLSSCSNLREASDCAAF